MHEQLQGERDHQVQVRFGMNAPSCAGECACAQSRKGRGVDFAYTYRRHIEAMFLSAGANWRREDIYANSPHLLEAMVALATHVTIVSPVQIRTAALGCKVLRLSGGSQRKIGFKVRRAGRLSPLGVAFRKALEDAASQMSKDFRSIGLSRAREVSYRETADKDDIDAPQRP